MLKNVKQSKKQSVFSKKWAQVEKKQKRYLNFQKKVSALHELFKIEILPKEHELCALLAQETRHLMTFISRKSFTQRQREDLTEWLESNLETLDHHPFVPNGLGVTIRSEYNDKLSNNFTILDDNEVIDPSTILEMRELLEEVIGTPDEFSDAELADFIRNPDTFTDYISQRLAEHALGDECDEFDEDFDDEDFGDDFFDRENFQQFDQQQQAHQKKLKTLFNASLLKKCYKKLAIVLHPDKELNLDLKHEKSELMAVLAKAKKDKDAFTIISMYQEYVPDNDLNLDKNVSIELLALIDEKLHQLDVEYHSRLDDGSIETMIWHKLGGRTKKEMRERKMQHLSDIQASCDEIQSNIKNSKNMKQLNKLLSQRRELRQMNPFANMGSLEELFSNCDVTDFSDDIPF